MEGNEPVRDRDWLQRGVTRRMVFGVLSGGLSAVAWNEMGLTRKKRRARKQPARVGVEAKGGATQRPISEFVEVQGTTQVFVPPVNDVVGWATPSDDPVLFAWIDYVGVADDFLLGALGTATSGKVIEQPQKDGRAKVHVNLHTRNALAWVIELDLAGDILGQIATKQPIFGFRPQEVDDDHPASLVDATLEVVFLNTAPGAPLPDLVKATALGEAPKGFALLAQKFRAHGEGTIRDADTDETSRGRLTVVQVAPRLDKCITADCFPAEIIKVQRVGH
jgi:hypothetical protein